eukprot:GFYU01001625.1.p1 GENE.GFYU01001625.1~~GFYU01001625.1.p1  ORF type:complete len:684 (+),score=198.94 GFYU01001625.1:158-2209(+)
MSTSEYDNTSDITYTSESEGSEVSDCEVGSPSSNSKINFTWHKVNYIVPFGDGQKQILNGCSGHVKGGQLMAILGASGSGKTSLLNALSGRVSVGVDGDISVNGTAVSFRTGQIMGFVKQFSQYLPHLTVREVMTQAAKLKLPFTMPESQKIAAVDDLIDVLGLKKCENTKVGDAEVRGVSGGELRRLSIGIELLKKPRLLFCDEPTTGLDSATALSVMQTLRKLSEREGCAIVCTIHQPRASILQMFDEVSVMAAGHCVYYGTPKHMTSYFDRAGYPCKPFENIADHVLDITNSKGDEADDEDTTDTATSDDDDIDGIKADSDDVESVRKGKQMREVVIQYLADTFAASPEYENLVSGISAIDTTSSASSTGSDKSAGDLQFKGRRQYATPRWYQLYLLIRSTIRYKLREPMALGTQLSYTILIPLMMGSVYYQLPLDQTGVYDRLAFISFTVMFQSFIAFDQALLFPKERQVFIQDHTAGLYSVLSFYLAHSLGDLPFHLLFAWISGSTCYWMVGFQSDVDKYLIFMAIYIAITVTGTSLLCFVSAMSKSIHVANALAMFSILIMMLFDGYYINLDNVPVYYRWLQNLSIMRWGTEAIAINEFKGLTFECSADFLASVGLDDCLLKTGDDALHLFSMSQDESTIGLNIAVLCAMIVGYRVVAYLAVRFLFNGRSFSEIIRE